ncbi:hypothetical protein GT346_20280, partial [Streptomyces sp. SID161]|nr:hypothetical protein [Streptomyces sp. SID161]
TAPLNTATPLNTAVPLGTVEPAASPEWIGPGATPDAALLLPAPGMPGQRGDGVRMPRPLPGAAGFGRLSPAVAKAAGRRRLAAAGDVLARHATLS